MDHNDLMLLVAEVMDRLQLRYLITGSMASTAYGEARFTNDVDVVVDLPASRIDDVVSAFPAPDFYISRQAVADAVNRRGQFNIILPAAGLKIDVIVASNSEFDRERLSRGRTIAVAPGRTVVFASPEDVVLKKLDFFQEGGSDKHLRDIAGILNQRKIPIDREYIATWVQKMRLSEAWDRIDERLSRRD